MLQVRLKNFTFLLIAVAINSFLSAVFTNGDQELYIIFYNKINSSNLSDIFQISSDLISTREPVYPIIAWMASNAGIDKSGFNLLLTIFYSFSFFQITKKLNLNRYIGILVFFCSFYSLILITELDRLKLAISFLMLIPAVPPNEKYKKIFFSLMCILSHAQCIPVIMGIFLSQNTNILYEKIKPKTYLFYTLLIFSLFILLHNQIEYKIKTSYQGLQMFDVFKSSIFILAYFYIIRKKEYLMTILPILLAVMFFGGSRLNIILYFVSLYYLSENNRGINLACISIVVYSLYKTILFFPNAMEAGTWAVNVIQQ